MRQVCLAIANSAVHEKLAQQCADAGVGLFKVRAADIVVMDAVEIGKGAVLSPFVTLISNIRIGRCFHANIYSHVAHDCVIGDFVTFAPGVKCNRNVVIADHVYVGIVRGQRRCNAGVRRWRSRQRQSDRRDHRRRADPAHPCRGGGASGGLALRHGSDHGAGRLPRAEGDQGCAQAHGARYKGRMVGAIGDVGAWSFCQDKIMTTGGEGGMVTTNDRDLWGRMWACKDHGKSWDAAYARACAGFSLAARELWHQRADDRDAGGAWPHPAWPHGRLDGGPQCQCRSDRHRPCPLGRAGRRDPCAGVWLPGLQRLRSGHRLPARAIQVLRLCPPRKPCARLVARPHRGRDHRTGCALLSGFLFRGLP